MQIWLLFFLTAIFSVLATGILSYISMAVMIGPWIDSTIVLLTSFIFIVSAGRSKLQNYNKFIGLITAGASLGGILATGCGFAFGTLYFLNPDLFNSWLNSPFYFMSIMTTLTLAAGSLGLIISDLFENRLIHKEQLPFPVGQMTYKLIVAQSTINKSIQLFIGFIISFLYSVIQSFYFTTNKYCKLVATYSSQWLVIPEIRVPMLELPMLISIGLIAGHVIAVPLAIGILTKIFITTPIYNYYFTHLNIIDFNFSFGSGMMVYGAFTSMLNLNLVIPKILNYIKTNKFNINLVKEYKLELKKYLIIYLLILSFIFAFFYYFDFSFLSQIYIIIFTIISAYQLLIIAGKSGIAPLARFATFVMIPGILIFGFNNIQITLVSTFVEVCGGIAVDALFGRKASDLLKIDKNKVKIFQWFGLIVSSISVGIIFWLLITKYGLGSERLMAQRCQTRALTVQVTKFDFFGIILGALFAALLKDFKISSIMVLGGILMPLDWSFVLTISGLISYFIKNNEEYYPIWSGIFAANSIWMILYSLFS